MKFRFRTVILVLLASLPTTPCFAALSIFDAGIGGEDEPLMPDQAFVMKTTVLNADMIRAEWDIVEGYYLYRNKFKFSTDTPGISLQPGIYPKGEIHEDEFFGKVETYRKHVAIDIPVIRSANAADLFDLNVVSQGCADLGICYPPQKKSVSLNLPPLPVTVASITQELDTGSSFSPLAAIKKLSDSLGLGSSEDEFLTVDKVFIYTAEVETGNTIRAHWDILNGYYMYRDKFVFTLEDADGISIGEITMPPGETKVDETFGEMVVYHNEVDILIPLNRTQLDPTPITLVAKYQGCAEKGFCYAPQTQSMPLFLPKGETTAAALSVPDGVSGAETGMVSEQDRIAGTLASGNLILTIITFFGFGLLLAFTPCVFPMIPILSSIIVGQGDSITTRKAFTMSLVYVLAMALTYTIAGVVAGLFGENLQAAFQNTWVLATFSAVFVALAFSMFGFYDIQMPTILQSKLTNISNRQKGGSLIGVAVMGLLSALIVGPCVAAPLAGALIYIGQTGDAVLGGLALFALSMGMGAPLLVIGTSAGKLMPKAGIWMDVIKAVFGVMMLAVAIWMIERIVPAAVSMSLWAGLLIVSAIYMGAIDSLGDTPSGWRKLWKGIGMVMLVYGALVLIGVTSGGKDVLQPLEGLSLGSSAGGVPHEELKFRQIKGLAGLDRELLAAGNAGQMVMLDFYADWCVSCKEMEKYTFSDPGVVAALKNVILLQADVTDNDDIDKALLSKFGIPGPPSILFFDSKGQEKRGYRLVGFLGAEKFKAHVDKLRRSNS